MEKFFSAEDHKRFADELSAAGKDTQAKPGGNNAINFTPAWVSFIAQAITARTNVVAQATKRHLIERDARIDTLTALLAERDSQLERHSEHLQRLQTRVEALERFKADK